MMGARGDEREATRFGRRGLRGSERPRSERDDATRIERARSRRSGCAIWARVLWTDLDARGLKGSGQRARSWRRSG